MKLCKKCDKRETCNKLCDEALKYVNQDQVEFKEDLLDRISIEQVYSNDEVWASINKSEKRIIYEMYFLDNRSVNDILFHIPQGRTRVYDIIKELKDGIEYMNGGSRRGVLRSHFVNRKSITEICIMLSVTKGYVSRIINEYLKEKGV